MSGKSDTRTDNYFYHKYKHVTHTHTLYLPWLTDFLQPGEK